MSAPARNYLFASSLLSTAHGFMTVAALFMSMPLLFDLNIFTDSTEQQNASGTYAIIEMCLAGGSFLIGTVGSFSTLASKTRAVTSTTQYVLGSFYLVFFIINGGIAALRAYQLGWLTDMGIYSKVGCRDDSFTGCPTARYLLANQTIETKSNCIFNAYNLENVDAGIKVDWSNPFNYDKANVNVLVASANSAGLNIDAMAMGEIHGCWYWGCSEVCGDRYKLNQTYGYISCGTAFIYLLLSLLSFIAASTISKSETLLGEQKKQDNQTDSTDDVDEETSIPVAELVEDSLKRGFLSSSDEGIPSVRFAGKELNFNLRM